MGVFINGMEMPEDWRNCPFSNGAAQCKLINMEICDKQHTHRSICPLVPVPPHGRLIDADALGQSIKESIDECHKWANEVEGGEMYARVSQSLGTFVECSLRVKAAPTIIEAEEGE